MKHLLILMILILTGSVPAVGQFVEGNGFILKMLGHTMGLWSPILSQFCYSL